MDSESEKSLWTELGFIVLVVIAVVCSAIFTGVGTEHGKYEMQKQAVKEGVAKWIVDKDGVVQFQWVKERDSE